MIFSIRRWLNFVLIAVTLFGCSEDTVIPPGDSGFHLYLELSATVDDEPLEYGKTYRDLFNRSFSVSQLSFYISNIRLIRQQDSSEVSVGTVLLAKNLTRSRMYVDATPAGNYSGLKFDIGLNPSLNHADPSQYADTSLLSSYHNMHYGNTAKGYIFFKTTGMADTSYLPDAIPDVAFEFTAGSDNLLRTIHINRSFEITGSSHVIISVEFDFIRLLKGIDLRTDHYTTTFENPLLALVVANNIKQAFRLADGPD
ncbi:MAG: hypothetical protein KatS3mg031_2671 [Chitinophagales bacterium]|nr:MAG: hypothetical protein KatS3mg031_2671 [Chitinophagales bacterium]